MATGSEIFFPENEIIVSKTDLKGRITYANQTFCHLAGYTEAELMGSLTASFATPTCRGRFSSCYGIP